MIDVESFAISSKGIISPLIELQIPYPSLFAIPLEYRELAARKIQYWDQECSAKPNLPDIIDAKSIAVIGTKNMH